MDRCFIGPSTTNDDTVVCRDEIDKPFVVDREVKCLQMMMTPQR